MLRAFRARGSVFRQFDPDRKMIGSAGGRVHPAGLETPGKAATDEAVIQMHAPRPVLADPAVAVFRAGLQMCLGIGGIAGPGRTPVIGVVSADHGDVFRTFGFHVEIAHDQEFLRQWRIRQAEFVDAGEGSPLLTVEPGAILEEGDLRQSLIRRNVVEVNGIDAQRAARRLDDRLQRTALQVELVKGPIARQEQVSAGADRVARKHHVAELKAPLAKAAIDRLLIDQHIAGRPEGYKMGGKQRRKSLDKIGITVPAVAAGHFLKRDHVRIADAVGDPMRVETAVLAKAILDVVADELHDTL